LKKITQCPFCTFLAVCQLLYQLSYTDINRPSDFLISSSIEEKTGKERRIAINSSIQKALKIYMSRYNHIADNYLFTSRKGKNMPITSVQAYRALNDAASDCKIDINFGTHTMRKTWGYWTYKSTRNNLGLVMDMLNHSSPSITLRYIGITQEQKVSTYLMMKI